MFATRKGTFLGGTACFGVFCVKIRPGPLVLSELQEPPPQKKKKTNTFLVRKVTHALRRNAWANRDELLHRCRGPRRNHLCRFVLRSLTVYGRGGGQILAFSIDLLRRPYNTLALPCECVILALINGSRGHRR